MYNFWKIKQTGFGVVCMVSTLLLTNCGFLRGYLETVVSDGYTANFTEYRRSFQTDNEVSREDDCAPEEPVNEQPLSNNSRWNKTWFAVSSAGYAVTVPADVISTVVSIPLWIPLYFMFEVLEMPT